MRITTWNVNGLRAVLGKGLGEAINALQADVLCLQEVRVRPEQLNPAGHDLLKNTYPFTTWNPAERPGYSGVATLARIEPDEILPGLSGARQIAARLSSEPADDDGCGGREFDSEGRVLVSRHPGFLLFNIYFPNGGRALERVPYKLDFYACLLDLCDRLHAAGEQIILCGDFNTSHQPIDLRNPRQNEKNTGFMPEERAWIDRYLEHGFVDVYRRLYPERVQYTWWTFLSNARSRNVGWRLDYFLVSTGLLPRIRDSVIHDDILGSDHCPVSLILD